MARPDGLLFVGVQLDHLPLADRFGDLALRRAFLTCGCDIFSGWVQMIILA